MSKISGMLDVGRRSLMNSQTALQVVGHNIANKSTEGYSRQRVEQQSNPPIGSGRLRVGTGATTSSITRINNEYLEKQIQKEANHMGMAEGRAETLARVEDVYNEQITKGLNQFISDFFNAFREMSVNPESLATRTLVKESGFYMSKDFQRVSRQLKSIQDDIDRQIISQISEVNEIGSEIATLNEKIQMAELTGGVANDERDRRELLLKELSKRLNIRYAESDTGQVTVMAGDSVVLVSGYDAMELKVRPSTGREGKREGNVDVYMTMGDQGTPFVVTRQIRGGTIGGILDVRDEVINGLISEVDEMAFSLAREVNKLHVQGYDSFDQRGRAFFTPLQGVHDAAERLSIDPLIAKDVRHIASATQMGAPGDNRIANAISSIQYQKIMNGGTATLDDHYNSIVGRVGIMSRKADGLVESQRSIVAQLDKIRDSISGVSLDEETTKMIEYQKTFDASARLIRTADEMLETVLNIKR